MKIQFAVNVAKNNKANVDLWFMDEGLSKIKETENRKWKFRMLILILQGLFLTYLIPLYTIVLY